MQFLSDELARLTLTGREGLRMGEKKQNKGVGVVLMMLLFALVPLGITSIILTIIGVRVRMIPTLTV